MSLRPPIPYFGGKQSIAEQIVAFFPDHMHYVEPFAGSLSVLLAKPPSRMETVNDLDRELVTFWRVLRDRTADLERVCALTPHSWQEYMTAREFQPVGDELETARRVWVLLTQGRNGTLREAKTGWRYFVGPVGKSMPGYLDGYLARFAPAAARLRRVSLESMPALDLIEKYGREPDVLLYVDPPYLGSERGWGNNYKHEMKAESEHRELAEELHSVKASVVLSGYPSPLYDAELYADWSRVEISSMTANAVEKARTEVLWCNRPLAVIPTLFELDGGDA